MIYLKVQESCKTKDALKFGLFEVNLNKKGFFFYRMHKCLGNRYS